jgi:predicted transporter
MFSEGGDVSHKRVISIAVTATICFTIVWAVIKYPALISDTLHSAMIFVAVMSGVATVAQIVSLVKGTPEKPTENGSN